MFQALEAESLVCMALYRWLNNMVMNVQDQYCQSGLASTIKQTQVHC